MSYRRILTLALTVLVLAGAAACSSPDSGGSAGGSGGASGATGEKLPDIKAVEVTGKSGTYSFAVTVSSPYDSPDRYADSIRVRSADGETVYGERELAHDHAGEQPFTRSVDDVEIPDGVTEVVVEGRDQVSGWGGETQTVTLPVAAR